MTVSMAIAAPSTERRVRTACDAWLRLCLVVAAGALATLAATPAARAQAAGPAVDGGAAAATRGQPEARAGAVDAPAESTATNVSDLEALKATPGLAEAERLCAGRPIAVAELLDCIGTRCQDREERRKLLSLTDLTVGKTLQHEALLLGVSRLAATGFFRIRQVSCTAAPTGARIRIRVLGNNVIRSIRIEGNKELFASELRNKLLFQPGDVLNPDSEEGKSLVSRQVAAYETLYQRAGFEKAKVQISTQPYGVGQVIVEIAVVEGGRERISGTRLQVLDPHVPNERELSASLVCPRARERALVQVSGLAEVDVFTRRAGVKARSRIREVLRRMGYHNPKVTVEHDQRDNTVQVEVRLGRCSMVRVLTRESSEQLVRDAAFRELDDDNLLDALPFVESGVFDLSEAERGRRELRAALENRGYLFADVDLDFRETPRSWGSRVASAITYRITTRYLAQVRGMHFCATSAADTAEEEGATNGCAAVAGKGLSIPASELQAAIVSRPYDVLDEGGFLSTAQMFGDLDQIRQYYRDSGYFEVRFELVAPPGSSGIVRRRRRTGTEEIVEYLLPDRGFRVRRPAGEHFIYVDVPFEEGRRSSYASVRVVGATTAGESHVRELLGAEAGGVASAKRLLQGLRRVEDDYRNLGYFQATVGAWCQTRNRAVEASGASGMQPCTADRLLAEHVDLEVRVHEGPRVRIGEVFVTGNFRTRAALLLRDMPAYGSDFSAAKLFDSLRALRDLGLFRSVAFQYIGRDEMPARSHIGIVVHVVEDDTLYGEAAVGFQTVNVNRAGGSGLGNSIPGMVDLIEHITSTGSRLGAGYGQRIGVNLPNLLFTVEGKLVQRNLDLFGGGKELSLVGRAGVTPNVSDVGPALLLAALVYHDRRFLGSDVGLRLFPAYFSRDFATTLIDLDKAGTAAEVSKAFGKLGLSVGVDGGVVRYRDSSDEPLSDWQLQYKVLPRMSFDGLDSPLNPTRGVYATLSTALVNVLTEKITKAADGTTSAASERGTFVKLEAQLKGMVTLRDTLTLAAMVRAGWAIGFDSGSLIGQLPANERYRLGGQLGLRGYADNGILQYDSNGAPLVDCVEYAADKVTCSKTAVRADGNLTVHGSLEARFPLLRTRGLWTALFWDWGGIGETWGALHRASIRHGIGAGLRYLVSGQIPVRLDYGVALDRRCFEPEQLGKGGCVKRDPFGQLHVGLLYSF